jgi:hypothetical protein
VAKTRTKSTMPFLPTNPFTPFICPETQYPSFKSSLLANPRCDLAQDPRTRRRSCPTHFLETSTGMISIRRRCRHLLSLQLRVQPTQATSTQSSLALLLFLHRCKVSLVRPCRRSSVASHTRQTSTRNRSFFSRYPRFSCTRLFSSSTMPGCRNIVLLIAGAGIASAL